jgi:tetratricopeptide (TPR) repeat protein
MLEYLESRARQQPDDAGSWRTLGRFHLQAQDLPAAQAALRRALDSDPNHVAANFDMADVLAQQQQLEQAASHFSRVVTLAPQSEYAQSAQQRLLSLPPPPAESEINQASYQIRSFDGADTTAEIAQADLGRRSASRWTAVIEAGSLYNSNVTLTPTSRDFFAAEAGSAQAFFNPDLEYRLVDGDLWRAGPSFAGYFGVNETQWSDLNLQSYRPGTFAERSVFLDWGILVPRIAYQYTLDQFAGQTFSDRHAIIGSLTQYWHSDNLTIVNWTLDHTDFVAGTAADPAARRDGWSHRVGSYHSWTLQSRWLESVGLGGELQWVDASGDDFAFRGTTFYGDATIPISQRLHWIVEAGTGYRDYYRSQLTPTRDETLWRAGTRLRLTFNERLSFAAVGNYDRFASKNELFDAQRYLAGLITTWLF